MWKYILGVLLNEEQFVKWQLCSVGSHYWTSVTVARHLLNLGPRILF